jgi:hypothetical protein
MPAVKAREPFGHFIKPTVKRYTAVRMVLNFPFIAIVRQPGDPPEISYITPEEVAQAAQLIETATGDNRQPYGLRFLDPKNADDERLRTCEALSSSALFQYRTLARKYQFKTEILKE